MFTSVQNKLVVLLEVKELKVQIKRFLGSGQTYWHGNSPRVVLPPELVELLGMKRGQGKYVTKKGDRRIFLFFETNKGILVKVVDKEVDKKLKEVFGFIDASKLSDEDLKLIFG